MGVERERTQRGEKLNGLCVCMRDEGASAIERENEEAQTVGEED